MVSGKARHSLRSAGSGSLGTAVILASRAPAREGRRTGGSGGSGASGGGRESARTRRPRRGGGRGQERPAGARGGRRDRRDRRADGDRRAPGDQRAPRDQRDAARPAACSAAAMKPASAARQGLALTSSTWGTPRSSRRRSTRP